MAAALDRHGLAPEPLPSIPSPTDQGQIPWRPCCKATVQRSTLDHFQAQAKATQAICFIWPRKYHHTHGVHHADMAPIVVPLDSESIISSGSSSMRGEAVTAEAYLEIVGEPDTSPRQWWGGAAHGLPRPMTRMTVHERPGGKDSSESPANHGILAVRQSNAIRNEGHRPGCLKLQRMWHFPVQVVGGGAGGGTMVWKKENISSHNCASRGIHARKRCRLWGA